jgi:hypothetical protein
VSAKKIQQLHNQNIYRVKETERETGKSKSRKEKIHKNIHMFNYCQRGEVRKKKTKEVYKTIHT